MSIAQRLLRALFLWIALMLPLMGGSAFAVDNDARIVSLRASCTEDGQQVPNCFTSSAAVIDWMKSTRDTNAGPLTVWIGPGTFGYFQFSGIDDVSIRGSGPGQTMIQGMNIGNSFRLNVQDLTVLNTFPAPVWWSGNGSSVWTNVHLEGGIYAWTETACVNTTSRPVHRWFSSRLVAKSKTVYEAACSENWFFGSELVLEASVNGTRGLNIGTHNGAEDKIPEVHLYGSVLRVLADADVQLASITAVYAGNNAVIHIHGTGIDVIGNDYPGDVIALQANSGGHIHASQSSYVMETPPPGKIIRINNNGGMIKAPYLWEENVLALGDRFMSKVGADHVSEVVCEGGVCMPHTLVYTNQCSTDGPWFNTVTGACRGQ